MPIEVRPARAADAASIASIHSRSWRWAYRDLLPASHLATLDPHVLVDRWARAIRARRESVVIGDLDGRPTGFITFAVHTDPSWLGRAGEVPFLYVDPDAVGRGVGRALLHTATTSLESAGMRWMVIRVLEGNHPARRFYERCGLRLDGHHSFDVVGGARLPVLRYARPLAPVFDFAAVHADR